MPFWKKEGRRGGTSLPCFPLSTTALPPAHSIHLLKMSLLFRKTRGLVASFEWTWVACFMLHVFSGSSPSVWSGLPLPSDWGPPENGLCIPPTRLRSSPTTRAGTAETRDCPPPTDGDKLSPPPQKGGLPGIESIGRIPHARLCS